jgi:hypothetical protein
MKILNRGDRSGRRGRRAGTWGATVDTLEARRMLALTINPTFDATVTSSPNSAAIQACINRTIDAYESAFSGGANVTANITFVNSTTGLGGSSTFFYTVKYKDYRDKLAAAQTTADDATALANSVPSQTNNPATNNDQIALKAVLARALGFSADPGPIDSTISLNTSICNLDRLTIDTSKYDLQSVCAHEIDEAIGTGSGLDGVTNGAATPTAAFADDVFRYDQTGARAFSTSSTDQAWFSFDGGSTRLVRFNQSDGGDFADWYSPGGQTPRVQDAFGTRGATANLNEELRRLDVLGFTPGATSAPALSAPGTQSAVEGATTSFNLGSFTDPDCAPWGITVDWGDGTAKTVFHLNSAGSLGTQAHKYAEEGTYTPTISITDFTSKTDTTSFTVNVSDPAVVATGGFALTPVEGADSGSQVVATFTDPGGAESTSNYSALIDWGDGSAATTGSITFSAGTFTVRGNHTYAEESAADHAGSNPYDITVTISHEAASNAVVHSSATVSDPAVTPTGGFTIPATEGSSTGTRTVATFTDPGGAEPLADYSAMIDWGDGTAPTAGTISFSGGVYTVQGSHTYATGLGLPDEFGNTFCGGDPPSYHRTITTTISHESAPTAQATSDATVAVPPGTAHLAGGNLIVVGTASGDSILVTPVGGDNQTVAVTLNSTPLGTFTLSGGGRIVVAGLGGNDNVQVAGGVRIETALYGGPGNDRLKGGAGRNIELGCDGDDELLAGNLGDLLVGGMGADRIVGGNNGDILVAGVVLDPVTSAEDARYGHMVAILNGGPATAGDDGAADVLTGSAGVDQFYYNFLGGGVLDRVTDKAEVAVDVL